MGSTTVTDNRITISITLKLETPIYLMKVYDQSYYLSIFMNKIQIINETALKLITIDFVVVSGIFFFFFFFSVYVVNNSFLLFKHS